MIRTNSKGFTIIELMFSTVIFSVVLLLCLSALIQIGRMYYKGITTSQTQNAARGAMDEITQAIQFSPQSIVAPTLLGPNIAATVSDANATDFACIGEMKYTFALDRQQKAAAVAGAGKKQIKHALWVSHDPLCLSGTASEELLSNPAPGGRDLLGENMRLTRFRFIPVGDIAYDTWQVDISVAYGDEDLLIPSDGAPLIPMVVSKKCNGPRIGTQFCAVSDLSTIVKRRVK